MCCSGKSQNSTLRRKNENPKLNYFEVDDERDDDSLVASLEVNNVYHAAAGYVIWLTPKVNGHTLKVKLDTGSAISTADRLAQLVERRTSVREVSGSSQTGPTLRVLK